MKKTDSIMISSNHKRELAEQFNTTKVTVQNALHFFNNSELAHQIRDAAKKILLKEASKV
tara:strand:- start:2106 stop:2285 length:180 start_codon:yes stop_codon:yes gene_type:complete